MIPEISIRHDVQNDKAHPAHAAMRPAGARARPGDRRLLGTRGGRGPRGAALLHPGRQCRAHGASTEVVLHFSEDVQARRGSIQAFDPDGAPHRAGCAQGCRPRHHAAAGPRARRARGASRGRSCRPTATSRGVVRLQRGRRQQGQQQGPPRQPQASTADTATTWVYGAARGVLLLALLTLVGGGNLQRGDRSRLATRGPCRRSSASTSPRRCRSCACRCRPTAASCSGERRPRRCRRGCTRRSGGRW